MNGTAKIAHGPGWDGSILSSYSLREDRTHELDRLPEGFAQGIWAKLAQQSEPAQMTSNTKAKYIKKMTTDQPAAEIIYLGVQIHQKGTTCV